MGADRIDRAGVSGGGGVTAEWGPHGLQVTDPRRRPHWALITGQATGTNRYAHAQVDDADVDGDFPGQTSTAGGAVVGTSDATGQPAYEINGRTDVPADSTVKVKLWPSRSGKYWLFEYTPAVTACQATLDAAVIGVWLQDAYTWYGCGPAVAVQPGSYQVTASVLVSVGSPGEQVYVLTRLFNCTTGGSAGVERVALVIPAGHPGLGVYHEVTATVEVASASTLQFQALSTVAGIAFANNMVFGRGNANISLLRVAAYDGCASGSGCPTAGSEDPDVSGSGSDGSGFSNCDESGCFDLGETVTGSASDQTGDCGSVAVSGTITRECLPCVNGSCGRWSGGSLDYPGGGSRGFLLSCDPGGVGWGLTIGPEATDIEFVSANSITKTVVFSVTFQDAGTVGCTGTVTLTFQGS